MELLLPFAWLEIPFTLSYRTAGYKLLIFALPSVKDIPVTNISKFLG
jgi:hypothetical protein